MNTFPDKYWRVAYEKGVKFANGANILAPIAFEKGQIIKYADARKEIEHPVIIVKKDDLLSLPRWLITQLGDYETAFENAVFFVLRYPPKKQRFRCRYSKPQSHMKRAIRYLSQLGIQLDFVHIPKTAGTSITQILKSTSIGYQYFARHQDLMACQNINEYSTIAGHFYLTELMEKRGAHTGDIFTVVRDPIERFLSAVGHARRPDEDPNTFGPSMTAMRNLTLMEFMQTPYADSEVSLTSYILGMEGHPITRKASAKERTEVALAHIREGRLKVFQQADLNPLLEYLRHKRGYSGSLETLNRTHNKADAFTSEEHNFCTSREFKSYFEEEIDFFKSAYSLAAV